MFNVKISLVTSSGLLLASKPESIDDTKQILATGLMTALISFSKEVHQRELQSISYHDRTVSFVRIHEFVLIIEALTEDDQMSETQIKQFLDQLRLCSSPLLEGVDPNSISEGEAELILDNCLQKVHQLKSRLSVQPFAKGEKALFKLHHSSKGWEIHDKEGSGSYIPKIALMLDNLKAHKKLTEGYYSLLTQMPGEKCSILTLFKTDGEISTVGLLKVPLELEFVLFRLFPLINKTIEKLVREDNENIEYLLTSIMDIEDPGTRISKLNLEDLSPSFLDKTLGKNLDKLIYSAIVGGSILVVGDKPTVKLVIDTISIFTQHLQTSTNVWINPIDLQAGEKCELTSKICGLSSQNFNSIKDDKSLLKEMIIVNLDTGKIEGEYSSSHFKKLFDTIKRLNVGEIATQIKQELDKLVTLILKISSFSLVDKNKAKQLRYLKIYLRL